MKKILFKKRTAKITALMAAKAQTFYEKICCSAYTTFFSLSIHKKLTLIQALGVLID